MYLRGGLVDYFTTPSTLLKFFSPLNTVFIGISEMGLRIREVLVEQFEPRAIIPPVDRNDESLIQSK